MQAAQSYRWAGRFRATSLAIIALLLSGFAGSLVTLQAQQIEVPVYTIRAGDTLDIVVTGHEKWSLTVTVRPDGRISYPGIGEMDVADITVQQLTERIEHALGPGGRHLRNPQVHVNIVGPRAPIAHVLGAVTEPGAIELSRGISSAVEVVTMAGGAAPDGDLTEVRLYHSDGTISVLNLEAEREGLTEQTVIRAGDVLMVPEGGTRYVGVLGAVGNPGEVPLSPRQQSIALLDLMVMVGGIDENADRGRAMILRHDGPIDVVSLDSVLSREIESPMLAGGDVLWIPPEPEAQYFAVTGAVEEAGQFEYRQGVTLADALALAGQLSEAANPEQVTIIRADGSKELIDIRPMVSGQNTDIARTPIYAEDIVLVPARDESYAVLGSVEETGFFTWDEETRLADAVARAGGFSGNAALQRVVLVRRTEDGRSPVVLQLDARKLLEGDNEAANWRLMPGDTVYVPAREDRGLRDTLSDPLAVLGVVGALERFFNW